METKKLSLGLLTVAICALGQGAVAHTGVKDTVTEGTTRTYNAFTVTHGCASNADGEGSGTIQRDVVAISAVFPNGAGAVVNKVDASGNTIEPIDLSTVINNTTGGVFTNLSPAPIYPNMFSRTQVTKDGNGNVRGFNSYGPAVNVGLGFPGSGAVGLAPFRISGITFKSDSCAKSLKIRIAVGNWCLKGHGNDAKDDRADIWIGHTTALFNDPELMPYSAADVAAGKFFWPTLTVNRDTVANPLADACAGGFDVAIEPSDTDVDTYLPFPASTVGGVMWPSTYK